MELIGCSAEEASYAVEEAGGDAEIAVANLMARMFD
jgi:hypothetical protein